MNSDTIKALFPVFQHRPSLVYVDNASTTQRLHAVMKAVENFEKLGAANVHRGLYKQAEEATVQFEKTRERTGAFIGAGDGRSIVFTKGTTESINMVAFGFLRDRLSPGDEVVVSAMEHHANLIPWQQVCEQKHCVLKIIPVDADGNLLMDSIPGMVGKKTKFLAVTHISNTLGSINPIQEIIKEAHRHAVPVLVDAAQSFSHSRFSVGELNPDFLVFSAHKMFGPFGVGVLYVRPDHWEDLRPLNFGGGAIRNVTFERTDWLDFPHKLEPGTPNISGVIGFSKALDFLETLRWDEVSAHNSLLGEQLRSGLEEEGFRVFGKARRKTGIVSFVHERIHPHDIAFFLASKEIAVRAGHHCTQPLLESLGVPATVRVSFSLYNSTDDVDHILDALRELKKFWG